MHSRYQKLQASLARTPASLLHWVSCVFIGIYVLTNQYFYAVSDKLCFVDHDWGISTPTFDNYNAGPAAFLLTAIKNLCGMRPDYHHYYFSNFLLTANFLIFGRTLFVYKMAMALPLLCLELAAYGLTYSVTKRELAGLLSAIIVLNLPIVVIDSRTQFPFIALTAASLLACLAAIGNLDLASGKRCVLFSMCMAACALIHPSAFLFIPFVFAYLFFSNRNRRRFAVLLLIFFLTAAWCSPAVLSWMAEKKEGAAFQDVASNIWRHIRAAEFPLNLQTLSPAFGGKALLELFAVNCGLFFFLRYPLRRFAADAAGEAPPQFVFLFLFMLYVLSVGSFVRAAVSWGMPQDTIMVFHVLCVILFVSLLFMLGRVRFGRRPIMWLYAALCAFAAREIVTNRNAFLIPPKPLRIDGEGFVDRTFIDDDMADISELLFYLQKENRRLTGSRDLGVFKFSVTLRDGENGIRVGPPLLLRDCWPQEVHDEFPSLIAQQAFFKGINMQWDNIADGGEGRMFGRISGRRYLFLIVGQEAGGNLWTLPEHGFVLSKIKEKYGDLYRSFFADSEYIVGRRICRNIFLYVYRLPA